MKQCFKVFEVVEKISKECMGIFEDEWQAEMYKKTVEKKYKDCDFEICEIVLEKAEC